MEEFRIDREDVVIVNEDVFENLIRVAIVENPNERPSKRAKVSVSRIPLFKRACIFDLGKVNSLFSIFKDYFTTPKDQYPLALRLSFVPTNSQDYVLVNPLTSTVTIHVKNSNSTSNKFLSLCLDYWKTTKAFREFVDLGYESYVYYADCRFYIKSVFTFSVNPVTQWTPKAFRTSRECFILKLFDEAFPIPDVPGCTTSSTFYECLDGDLDISLINQPTMLKGTLLPFQIHTLSWMLQREKFAKHQDLPFLFERVQSDSQELYLSRPLGVIQRDVESAQALVSTIRGGILAEEMGLGKTIETISLILEHKFQVPHTIEVNLEHIKTTLIITPFSILQQWIDEIHKFAPHLNVYHYLGINYPAPVQDFGKFDIILTTYRVLSHEIHHARINQRRSLRHVKKYSGRISPLVQYVWWRICLDEAQMVESGASNAAALAAQLHRVNAWAITGTPIKKGLVDLYGLLVFLRFTPLSQAAFSWRRLIELPSCQSVFKSLFRQISCRHTQNSVKNEMHLPPYTRILFQLEFTVAEDEYYRYLFRQMLEHVGLTEQLTPFFSDWSFQREADKMKKWLVRLRQICVHPTVGQANRSLLKVAKPLQTVEAVVDTMITQCHAVLLRNQRHFLSKMITKGQLYDQLEERENALRVWTEVLDRLLAISEPLRQESKNTLEEKNRLIKNKSNIIETENDDNLSQIEALQTKYLAINKWLRSWLELEHKALFFIASVHFTLGNTEQENDFYRKAEVVRRELLKESEADVTRLMNELRVRAEKQDFVTIPHISDISFTGGIRSRDIFERIQSIGTVLNEQANQLHEWRQKIVNILTTEVVDNDADPDGEEYAKGLEAQTECTSYLEVFRKCLMDRTFLVSSVQSSLQEYDHYHRQKEVGTELDERLEEVRKSFLVTAPVAKGLNPMRVDTLKTLDDMLKQLYEQDMRPEELEMIRSEKSRLDDVTKKQIKASRALERDYETMRTLLNSRIEYFRQLQHISDSVVQYTVEEPTMEINRLLQQEATELSRIEQTESRYRYLINLKAETTNDQLLQQKHTTCIICTDKFDVGAITSCGHIFCDDCLNRWYKSHRRCPSCKYLQQKKAGEKSVVFSQWADVLEVLQTALSTNGVKCIRFDHRAMKRGSLYDPVSKFKQDPEIRVFMLHSRTQSSGLTLVNATNVFLCEPLLQSAIEAQAISRVHRIGQKQTTNVFLYTVKGTVEERIHARAMQKRAEHEQACQSSTKTPTFKVTNRVDETTEMQQNVQNLVTAVKYGGGEIVEDQDLDVCLFGKQLE